MFRVVDKRYGAAIPFDAIANASAGMGEARCADRHAVARRQDVTRLEVYAFEARLTDVRIDREPRGPHEVADHFLCGHQTVQMP
ncbi:hypothetical protein D9M69_708270 [compost metagenome]